MSKSLVVNILYKELSKGVRMSKGLKVNILHLEFRRGSRE